MKTKYFWLIGAVCLIFFLSIPTFHLLTTKWKETRTEVEVPQGYTNDASQLNLTKMDTIIAIPADKNQIEAQLKDIFKYAREKGLKVSISGAKHSMGGHTISPDGVLLNMLPYKHMELDTVNNILSIGSGALWEDALNYLDSYGKSIAIDPIVEETCVYTNIPLLCGFPF